tara:strand:+ start:3683 stop:4300 length:618 start_codon:yes stop_codon:yes gene_type:complete
MQPEDGNTGGIKDSVISGDVHNHNYANQGMPQPQQIIINPNTGLPQNVIIIQEPSAGPKVVGILVIIWGGFTILGEVIGIGDTLELGGFFIAMSLVNIGLSVGFILGGIMMTNYQKRGVHLSLVLIAISAIVGMAAIMMMPDILDDIAEEENLTAEEREGLDEYAGTVMGIGAIFVLICNGICGLIIAIPLMISNNGLDDSSLFG